MRRAGYWLAVLVAAAVTAVGCLVAYARYRDDSDPAAVVRAYFAALARGDAPGALALAEPVAGSGAYLTSAVLHDQLTVAPISSVTVTGESGSGGERTVDYSSVLAFAAGTRTVTGQVGVRRDGGSWRLAQPAARVQLVPLGATSRFTIAGAEIPDDPITLFPGAVPVLPDTANLRPNNQGAVALGGPGTVDIGLEVSTAGRTAVLGALRPMLATCFPAAGPSGAGCPLPSDPRAVPASVRGTLHASDIDRLTCTVSSDADGAIEISGSVRITGSYQQLDGNNLAHVVRGTFDVYVTATTPSVGAPHPQFTSST